MYNETSSKEKNMKKFYVGSLLSLVASILTMGCSPANVNIETVATQVTAISQTATILGMKDVDVNIVKSVNQVSKGLSDTLAGNPVSFNPATIQTVIHNIIAKQWPNVASNTIVTSAIDLAIAISVPQVESLIDKYSGQIDKDAAFNQILRAAFTGVYQGTEIILAPTWNVYMKSGAKGMPAKVSKREGPPALRQGPPRGERRQGPPGERKQGERRQGQKCSPKDCPQNKQK
jgi:hypothetical protein